MTQLDPLDDVLGRVRDCRVLGGHGFLGAGQSCDLVFTRSGVRVVSAWSDVASVPYENITALEIGGPGRRRRGGRFFGGGFGLVGAAEGILVATALNMLTSRTDADTVICLQTRDSELFLHLGGYAPDDVRMSLSPVFSIMRQKPARTGNSLAPAAQPGLSIADELAKLGKLKDAGLLTEEEFAVQKARLLS